MSWPPRSTSEGPRMVRGRNDGPSRGCKGCCKGRSNPELGASYDERARCRELRGSGTRTRSSRIDKVPAPSGGPVAPPPGGDSPPTAQEVVTGAATAHAEQDAAAQIAPPGEPALPPSATAGENPARPVSVGPVVELADTPPRGGGAATAVQVRILPGPPVTSRKAKPGTPCGGPSCRETQQWWIHDPRTCPLYKGKAQHG
jgi:hypothetical protein